MQHSFFLIIFSSFSARLRCCGTASNFPIKHHSWQSWMSFLKVSEFKKLSAISTDTIESTGKAILKRFQDRVYFATTGASDKTISNTLPVPPIQVWCCMTHSILFNLRLLRWIFAQHHQKISWDSRNFRLSPWIWQQVGKKVSEC